MSHLSLDTDMNTATITGFEANVLLFALDQYLRVDASGRVRQRVKGYTSVELQDLRDRLMAIHEHPDSNAEVKAK